MQAKEGFPGALISQQERIFGPSSGFFEPWQLVEKLPRESAFCEREPAGGVDTLLAALYSQDGQDMSQIKIQVGQLWKKDTTGDIYLVTRLYSEALNTMAVLRKSGAEREAQIRVRVERGSKGQTIQGFSPAQEEESY